MNIIILAGGGGTRLWPMSRKNLPKQFSSLISDLTLFEETFNRIKNDYPINKIFISTTAQIAKLAKKILPEVPKDNYIIEPEKRDTGPAMAYAAAYLLVNNNPSEPMVFLPSDHYIKESQTLVQYLKEAEKLIKKTGKMIDIAIAPTFSSVNLGYTKIGKLYQKINNVKFYHFLGHKEKPDLTTAKKFLKSKNYLWHANYFMWTPKLLLNAYQKYAPGIYQPIEKIIKALKRNDQKTVNNEFSKTEKISIDYAVAEHINPKDVLIIKAEFTWSDIGSWNTLYDQLLEKSDSNKNLIKANSIIQNCKNCLIYGPKEKLITTIGVSDLAIVDTSDALLICKKDQSHLVKKIIEILQEEGREKYL